MDQFRIPKTVKAGVPAANVNKLQKEIKRDAKQAAKVNKGLVDEVIKENQAAAQLMSEQIGKLTTEITKAVAEPIVGEIKTAISELTAIVRAIMTVQPAGSAAIQAEPENIYQPDLMQDLMQFSQLPSSQQEEQMSPASQYTETQLPQITNAQEQKSQTSQQQIQDSTNHNTNELPTLGNQTNQELYQLIKSQQIQIDNLIYRLETLEGASGNKQTTQQNSKPQTQPKQLIYAPTVPIDLDGNTLLGEHPAHGPQPIDFTEVTRPKRRNKGPRPSLSETTNEAVKEQLTKHYEERKEINEKK